MKASDIMTLGAATVGHDATFSQALRLMINHRIRALPVLDDRRQLLGIVTEGDFVRSGILLSDELLSKGAHDRAKALESRKVSEIMSRSPVTIGPEASIREIVELMEEHTLKVIPVVSDGETLGIISQIDLLKMLIE